MWLTGHGGPAWSGLSFGVYLGWGVAVRDFGGVVFFWVRVLLLQNMGYSGKSMDGFLGVSGVEGWMCSVWFGCRGAVAAARTR